MITALALAEAVCPCQNIDRQKQRWYYFPVRSIKV